MFSHIFLLHQFPCLNLSSLKASSPSSTFISSIRISPFSSPSSHLALLYPPTSPPPLSHPPMDPNSFLHSRFVLGLRFSAQPFDEFQSFVSFSHFSSPTDPDSFLGCDSLRHLLLSSNLLSHFPRRLLESLPPQTRVSTTTPSSAHVASNGCCKCWRKRG